MNSAPFTAGAPGISYSATATVGTGVALPANKGNVIRIVNEGPNIAFFDLAITLAGAIATVPTTGNGTTDCVGVLAGSDVLFTRSPSDDLYISFICRATATAVLTVYVGEGTN